LHSSLCSRAGRRLFGRTASGKGYAVHGVKRRSSSFNTERVDHLYDDPHFSGCAIPDAYGDLTDATNLIR